MSTHDDLQARSIRYEPARRRDHGSAVLAVAIAVVLVFTTAVATTELGLAMVHRQRAQHAADAAALAGLDGGAAGAARLAQANGARLVAFARTGAVVTVTVALGDATATARATDGP